MSDVCEGEYDHSTNQECYLREEFEDPDDRYWLWRFMIDEKQQGKGCGTAALSVIIQYFKEQGANNIRLSAKKPI